MEAIVRPVSYADMDLLPSLMFRVLRGPLGEFLILRRNLFVEWVLPASVQRELSVDGIHFVQEDSPDEIGRAIVRWIDGLEEIDR